MAKKTAGVGLYLSCENGNYDVVSKMISSVEGIDVNFQNANQDGNTPLIIAASNGHFSIVSCLLDAGADHRIQNQMGFTALQIATVNGHSAIIKALTKAEEDFAKLERENSLKLPLHQLGVPLSTIQTALDSVSVDPHDPTGLTLSSAPDSPTRSTSVTPIPRKKRDPSMGGSPTRKVSFAENATSSVMIIPSKEDVKLMLHKSEYNHVCSPHLDGALSSSFDTFAVTVKNISDPISQLKFKKKMKRAGTIVPYKPPSPVQAKPVTPPSPTVAAEMHQPPPQQHSPPSQPQLSHFHGPPPSVAASALNSSFACISVEEAADIPPQLILMSPKTLTFKTAATVALATVHPPRHDVVTDEDDSISMSVDLSAMGLYVSFDDNENVVVKKAEKKNEKRSPTAAAAAAAMSAAAAVAKQNLSTNTSAPAVTPIASTAVLPSRMPTRGISRESAGSFHVDLNDSVYASAAAEVSKAEIIIEPVVEKPKEAAPVVVAAAAPTVTPTSTTAGTTPNPAFCPVVPQLKTESIDPPPGVETILSDEIVFSETQSTKIPFSGRKGSRSNSLEVSVPVEATVPVSEAADSQVNTLDEDSIKLTGNTVRNAMKEEEEEVSSDIQRVSTNTEDVKPTFIAELPEETPSGVGSDSAERNITRLSTIEEGSTETPSSSSKIRDARRPAGKFVDPFSIDTLLTQLETAQEELNVEVKKEISPAVVSSTGSSKKLGFHHVADVVAEAIRVNIAAPVTFTPNGPVKPEVKAKAQALSSSFSGNSTLSMADMGLLATIGAGRSVSFAADTVNSFTTNTTTAAVAAVAAEGGASNPSVAPPTVAPSMGLSSISESGAVSSGPGPPPARSPKMVTVPMVGRKQSVVSVGGRKKSLAMLLSPTVKAIGSATKAGESVDSLRNKMFQEAKRRAEEVAESLARRKEEAANLAALLKAKQEAELKRKAELIAKQEAIILRRGKAKGYGFQSIKAGLRHREYKDTQHNSPYIRQVMERDSDDSDTDSDWEAESQKSVKGAGAPGMPAAYGAGGSRLASSNSNAASLTAGSVLPSIDVSQSVSSVDLKEKVVSLLVAEPQSNTSAESVASPDKIRARDPVSSMLQINDPQSNQTHAVRKTIAMIQSDIVLENKFKWAKKAARAGSSAYMMGYHDLLKEQYEEEQSRLFHEPLPEIKKSPQKRAQTAGSSRTKPSLCVSTSQIITSHLTEAHNFADQVNNHNQSMYIPSDTPLKPSQQAFVNMKPKKQFRIINVSSAESVVSEGSAEHKHEEDGKSDLRASSLEMEENIYKSIIENNGSLVFIDRAKDLAWHEFNVDQSSQLTFSESIASRAVSPAEKRKFYDSHQIGIGKLVNAYRPWSSPAKLHKVKPVVGFDEISDTVMDDPDQMSATVDSSKLTNNTALMSQSLPGSRNGPRSFVVPEGSPSPIKFENSMTMERSQITLGSSMKKRLPLMINLVKANIPRQQRTESEDYLEDEGEDDEEVPQ